MGRLSEIVVAGVLLVLPGIGEQVNAMEVPPLAPHSQSLNPPKVASINLCADQLILALADTTQIVSLSALSHEQAGSYYYDKAMQFPVNSGQAGEVMQSGPDVVVAGSFSNRYTIRALESMGLRVETLPISDSVETLFSNIEQLGAWLGQSKKSTELIASLRARLSKFESPELSDSTIAVYDPNGYTVGENTLRGDVLKRAGWHNVAQDAGIEDYGVLPLETMLTLRPDVLMESPYSPGSFSRAQLLSHHPALRRASVSPLVITVPSAQTICGGPWTIDLIERLIGERKRFESLQSLD